MAKRNGYLDGSAAHRRTESDYMGTLLDTVTLDDWRDVVTGALQSAKEGDGAARIWLAQYLIGRPDLKAPSPLNVVVQQFSGKDPLVDCLARPIINKALYPSLHANDDWENKVRAVISREMSEKLSTGDDHCTETSSQDKPDGESE